jgi:small-conductance mechanosensitive channel
MGCVVQRFINLFVARFERGFGTEKSAVENAAFAFIFVGAVAIVAATGGGQIWIGIGGAGAMLIGVGMAIPHTLGLDH